MLKVKQLPSRYLLVEGKYHIEYSFRVEGFGYFTDLATLWETALGTTCVNISEDARTATYLEESPHRAVKYSDKDLTHIFEDLLVGGWVTYLATETPEKYRVTDY